MRAGNRDRLPIGPGPAPTSRDSRAHNVGTSVGNRQRPHHGGNSNRAGKAVSRSAGEGALARQKAERSDVGSHLAITEYRAGLGMPNRPARLQPWARQHFIISLGSGEGRAVLVERVGAC
jgi:hypothetical protein